MTQPRRLDPEKHSDPAKADPATNRVRKTLGLVFGEPAERGFDIGLWDGSVSPGRSAKRDDFSLVIRRRGALRRMLLPPSELSIAESYINGDVDIEGNLESAIDLADAVASRLRSAAAISRLAASVVRLPAGDHAPGDARAYSRRLKLLNPTGRRGGADAIQFHYDLGNDFYSLWLDKRMTYTCAYFRSEDDDLDTAQLAKLDHICRKLRLKKGERLLDIGCGWGSLIIHAAERYGVDAVGITLSQAQADLAREKIADRGLSHRCTVRLQDYRDLPAAETFDKIVSVGMMEHVAEREQPKYFAIAFRALRPGGLFLDHFIVSNRTARRSNTLGEEISRRLWKRDAFMDKYVFPDGRLVALGSALAGSERAGFETRDVESLREHYAMTLRWWLSGLEKRQAEAVRLVGEKTYRIWRLAFSGSANGFSSGSLNLVQLLLSKHDHGDSRLPLTRDDIHRQ